MAPLSPNDSNAAGSANNPIERYVVEHYLAEGGMGALYLGKKLGAGGFEKQVVLKQLLPEYTSHDEFIELFLREARLSATLDHANIVHTIDFVTAGDEHFIVMEYVDGADLRSMIKRSKRRDQRFSPAAGIFIAGEILAALAYAHAKKNLRGQHLGIIHRDISPSNILISKNGEVKLTDFGIAKASTHKSIFYQVKGKFGYMSPEQAKAMPIDARSDLYSLAICLYESITGERLFIDTGITSSPDTVFNQEIPDIREKLPRAPASLNDIIQKALSRDINERFQDAGEFQDALLRLSHREGLPMSSPDLAVHLRSICGDPDGWRDEEEEPAVARGGTELYDGGELEGSKVSFGKSQLLSVVDGAGKSKKIPADDRRSRTMTSITHLGELQGKELTSMIKLDVAPASEPAAGINKEEDEQGENRSGFDTLDEPIPGDPSVAEQRASSASTGPGAGARVSSSPASSTASEQFNKRESTPSARTSSQAGPGSWRPLLYYTVAAFLLAVGVAAAVGLRGEVLPEAPQSRQNGTKIPSH